MRTKFRGATYRGTTYVRCRLCRDEIRGTHVWHIDRIPLCRNHYDMWERKLDAAIAAVEKEFERAADAALAKVHRSEEG